MDRSLDNKVLHNPRAWCALIALVTVAAFSPLLTADFAGWDDAETIAHNPRLNPPSLANLLYFWNPRHPYMDLYVPVTYTVWSAVAAGAYVPTPVPGVSSLNPWIFHGLNVLLHAASALTVFAILRRLVRHAPAAAAAALLFALHPVQVEPVGWASGTKDVLWGLFALIAVWQYLRFSEESNPSKDDTAAREVHGAREGREARGPSKARDASPHRWRHYGVATAALVLGMLSKPTAVVVPIVAAVLDYFLLRRPIRKTAAALLPWLLLTIPVIWIGKMAQPANTARVPEVPLYLRPLVAGDALAFYVYKLVWPLRLGIDYGRTPAAVLAGGWARWTWIVPAAVAVLLLTYRRRLPWLIAAGAVFVLGVAPVLGLVPFDFQYISTVADHYLYFAMLGPALAAAYALAGLGRSRVAPVAWGCCAAVLAALALRTFVQSFSWRDSVALFTHAASVNPASAVARTQLGETFIQQGDAERQLGLGDKAQASYQQALTAYREAVRLQPESADAHLNVGTALALLGNLDAAEAEYREAMRLDPNSDGAALGLARVAEERGRVRDKETRRQGDMETGR